TFDNTSGSEETRHKQKQTAYTSSATNRSVEEQQTLQMEKVTQRMNTSTSDSIDSSSQQDLCIVPAIQDSSRHHTLHSKNVNKEKFKKDVKTSLNHKGLVNGIIMSEVLGPPRARKPFRSVIAERSRHTH